MLNTVDAFTLVKLSLHVEQVVSQTLAAYLVRKPDIFAFFNDLVEFGNFQDARELLGVDGVAVIDRCVREKEFTHFNFNLGRGVKHASVLHDLPARVAWLRELFKRNFFASSKLFSEPDYSSAAFAQQTELFMAFGASIAILGLLHI